MVSVIVPNYNHALYLKQRIDSVLNQSYQNFELIILDDYSTDDSIDIIKSYETHPKISQIVFNQKNSGSTFKQWAKGVNLAQGEYVWIAESDDFAESNFLQECINVLEKHPDVALVYTDSNIIAEHKIIGTFKEKNQVYYPETDWQKNHLATGLNELENHLIQNCSIYNVSAVVFRKTELEKTTSTITQFKYAGDWVCYMLIALNNNIYYIAQALNNYRTHLNNATKKSNTNYTGMYERILARTIIWKQLNKEQKVIVNKAKKLNLIELRAILGGFIRGRISFTRFIDTLKNYI
jgi:glycosyltransferase involved in cell wall biosynthesis